MKTQLSSIVAAAALVAAQPAIIATGESPDAVEKEVAKAVAESLLSIGLDESAIEAITREIERKEGDQDADSAAADGGVKSSIRLGSQVIVIGPDGEVATRVGGETLRIGGTDIDPAQPTDGSEAKHDEAEQQPEGKPTADVRSFGSITILGPDGESRKIEFGDASNLAEMLPGFVQGADEDTSVDVWHLGPSLVIEPGDKRESADADRIAELAEKVDRLEEQIGGMAGTLREILDRLQD